MFAIHKKRRVQKTVNKGSTKPIKDKHPSNLG